MTDPVLPTAENDAATGFPTYPCCEHCVAEADGKCWADKIGHGAYCLDCQNTDSRVR